MDMPTPPTRTDTNRTRLTAEEAISAFETWLNKSPEIPESDELLRSAIFGDFEKMKALVEAGHPVDPKRERGDTPLTIVSSGSPILSHLRRIHNADLKFDDSMYRSEENVKYIKCVRLLLAHGADVNHETDLGTTPLRNAILNGQIEIESILRLAGATNEGKGEIRPGPIRR